MTNTTLDSASQLLGACPAAVAHWQKTFGELDAYSAAPLERFRGFVLSEARRLESAADGRAAAAALCPRGTP